MTGEWIFLCLGPGDDIHLSLFIGDLLLRFCYVVLRIFITFSFINQHEAFNIWCDARRLIADGVVFENRFRRETFVYLSLSWMYIQYHKSFLLITLCYRRKGWKGMEGWEPWTYENALNVKLLIHDTQRYMFLKWGTQGKLVQLKQRYEDLFKRGNGEMVAFWWTLA